MQCSILFLVCSFFDGAGVAAAELAAQAVHCGDDTSLLQSSNHANAMRTQARNDEDEVTSAVGDVDSAVVVTGTNLAESATVAAVTNPIATVVSQPAVELATAQSTAQPVVEGDQFDAFDLFDLDGDGELTRQEIFSRLSSSSMGAKTAGADAETSLLQIGGGMESDAAGVILARFDVDGMGTVSRAEFDLQQYEAVLAQRRLEADTLQNGDGESQDYDLAPGEE